MFTALRVEGIGMAELTCRKRVALGLTVYLSVNKYHLEDNGYECGGIQVRFGYRGIHDTGLRFLHDLWRENISDIYIS